MKRVVLSALVIALFCVSLSADVVNPDPEIVELGEMTVIGYQSLISMKHNLIFDLWMRYMAKIGDIQNLSDPKVSLGITYWGEEKDDDYLFFHLVGMQVTDFSVIPQGMTYLLIPAHKYAKFTHRGSLESLSETYGFIYGEWATSGVYPISGDFYEIEWYDERFNPSSSESELDIYVPIE